MKYEKCKIILLSTEDKTKCIVVDTLEAFGTKNVQMGWLNSIEEDVMNPDYELPFRLEYFHLYITSDEEIKEGDWFINEQYYAESIGHDMWQHNGKINPNANPRKVISSTDKELGLPRPSNEFIKAYCDKGGIDEVLVEYESYHGFKTTIAEVEAVRGDSGFESNWNGKLIDCRLKVAPDNTITIKSAKNSWNREEVIELLKNILWSSPEMIRQFPDSTVSDIKKEEVNKWINQYL